MREIPKQNSEKEAGNEMEFALSFCYHLDNPCEAEVAPGRVENLREFWIREAKRFAESTDNPYAKEIVEDKIKEYEK